MLHQVWYMLGKPSTKRATGSRGFVLFCFVGSEENKFLVSIIGFLLNINAEMTKNQVTMGKLELEIGAWGHPEMENVSSYELGSGQKESGYVEKEESPGILRSLRLNLGKRHRGSQRSWCSD